MIAFMVVASVFAYTVLSAGILVTSEGEATVYSGIKAAGGAMEIKGAVTAKNLAVAGESLGTGDGVVVLFTTANNPSVDGSQTVYLDAAEQTKTTHYTIVNSTGVVTFLAAPGIGVAVTIDYQQASVNEILFSVSAPLKDSSINMTTTTDSDSDGLLSDEDPRNHQTTISYFDTNQRVPDLAWTWTQTGRVAGTSDSLLEYSENMTVTVSMNALSPQLLVDGQFTLEIRSADGTMMRLERTIPSIIDPIMNLH